VIVDGTADSPVFDAEGNVLSPEKQRNKMRAFKKHGYDVRMLYVNAPTDLAVIRSTIRAFDSGRHVPEGVIREMHAGVSQRFEHEMLPALKEGLISRIFGFDTTGTSPVEVFRTHHGRLQVRDRARYDAFRRKAHE
jgi:predicted ABC-type ATPase